MTLVGGGFLQALLSHVLSRRKNKVDEARIIAEVSIKMRKELFDQYEERGKTISVLRKWIIKLTDLIDQVIPRIGALTTEEIHRLKETALDTRLAGLAAEI